MLAKVNISSVIIAFAPLPDARIIVDPIVKTVIH